jgi:dTDP-4-dehydrorhamnose reductase
VTIINHANWQPGIYHFSNEGEISWYEFALAIQEIGGFDCEITEFQLGLSNTAQRPSILYWIKVKLKASFGVLVPDYIKSLTRCMEEVNDFF